MTPLNSLQSSAIDLLVIFFINVNPSSSTPIENDTQMGLTTKVNTLQHQMNQLVVQLEEEKFLRGNLQLFNAELEKRIHQLAVDTAKQNVQYEAKIDLLVAKNLQQDEEINHLKNKLKVLDYAADSNEPKALLTGNDVTMIKNGVDYLISDDSLPRLPPSSCRQLSTIGHYLDGIYLVANPDTNKIETVYCGFETSTLSETLYGSVDVKTKSIHFYVQRSNSFSLTNAVVPFDIVRLNAGGAMNPATGVFTAPVNGIYHFEFFGLKSGTDPAPLYIFLQANGMEMGRSYAFDYSDTFRGLSGISSSLKLKVGDQVRIFKGLGTLHDTINEEFTHFTGWLVEEDLVLS